MINQNQTQNFSQETLRSRASTRLTKASSFHCGAGSLMPASRDCRRRVSLKWPLELNPHRRVGKGEEATPGLYRCVGLLHDIYNFKLFLFLFLFARDLSVFTAFAS